MAGFCPSGLPKGAHRLLEAYKAEQQDADDDIGPPGAERAIKSDVSLD